MSCFHPCFIQKFVNPYNSDDFECKFISSDYAKNILECREILEGKYQGSATVDDVYFSSCGGKLVQFIQIPCGKCIGCRIDYKRSWADRLTYHSFGKEDNSYFITLTYDDDHLFHLPYNEDYDIYSIDFNDITDFIQKLRNKFKKNMVIDSNGVPQGIDYFYACEYGDSSFRCHAHLILFNLPLEDLEYFGLDDNGQPVYVSNTIDDLWQKGIHTISRFTWHNAAYVAGYVEKKLKGRRQDEYTALGLFPEGCRMSRRPGLAFDYYVNNYSDIWKNNGLDVDRTINSSGHLGIPRYFRKLATDGVVLKKGSEPVKLGFDEFNAWRKRTNDLSNTLNPLKVERTSFDLSRVRQMLEFEEREILSRSKNRKL